VHKHISTLEAKQYLKRGFNQSRSLSASTGRIRRSRFRSWDASRRARRSRQWSSGRRCDSETSSAIRTCSRSKCAAIP
jgi:hypothetical protein